MKHKIDWKKVSEGLGISEENTKNVLMMVGLWVDMVSLY